jgi:predicted short-subunit dehydrogenase-like oxidoreductase (DUF2520 family)
MRRLEGPVLVVGAGKVGRALARALRAAGVVTRGVSARRLLAGRASVAGAAAVIVAARDADVAAIAEELVRRLGRQPGGSPVRVPVVHCAGALGPEALWPLARAGHPVGVMHPLLSFAAAARPPALAGAALVVHGEARAAAFARLVARKTGMRAVVVRSLDAAAYHAAAALTANGAATLAVSAAALLVRAGVPARQHGALLGPLLGSVATNMAALGPDRALTGPVRRGDVDTVRRHLQAAEAAAVLPLFREILRAQLPVAQRLGLSQRSARGLARLVKK